MEGVREIIIVKIIRFKKICSCKRLDSFTTYSIDDLEASVPDVAVSLTAGPGREAHNVCQVLMAHPAE